jgi:hypothetical protein
MITILLLMPSIQTQTVQLKPISGLEPLVPMVYAIGIQQHNAELIICIPIG